MGDQVVQEPRCEPTGEPKAGKEKLPEPIEDVADIRLERDAGGRLVLKRASGEALGPVVPRRCFPWSCTDGFVALCGKERRELALIERLADLDPDSRRHLEDELAAMEFIPTITAIEQVERIHDITRWRVQTDCGPATFEIKRFDEVRDLPRGGLVLTDAAGNQYRLDPKRGLDRRSLVLVQTHLGA